MCNWKADQDHEDKKQRVKKRKQNKDWWANYRVFVYQYLQNANLNTWHSPNYVYVYFKSLVVSFYLSWLYYKGTLFNHSTHVHFFVRVFWCILCIQMYPVNGKRSKHEELVTGKLATPTRPPITQAVNHRKKSIEKYTDEYIYMVSVHTSST